MSAVSQDFVGRDVYARDGDKIGQVKELVYGGDYAVVKRSFFTRLVVPVEVLHDDGGKLILPFASSYLDNAPRIDPRYELSPRDKAVLDRFYLPKAA
jgi:hypothetical protein